ncbi:OmpW/AlkL family protein [Colwellia sp. 12G3]|uniref:OmpW/AlkL family protein n=1 Tax=Colwellia sp. 12G3 TaxID=2058299 RepID=UPI000C34C706|nr:OmpW family outer membrane protein [Colwellia sp. 12G3]PKI15721.1 outer membrane protein OmpW [Colwellia sp. 12G3]
MNKTLLTIALLSTISTISTAAVANQAGDILIRGGATMVSPDSGKSTVLLSGEDSGLALSVGDNTQLGLNFVYFFDSNWAVELLAATPFDHEIKLHSGNEATLLADTKQLPPTLSALYYFNTATNLRPYVGVGINYTVFFDNSFTGMYSDAGFSDLELDNSFGYAIQIGADYEINTNWSVNVSARYIDISTDASFAVGGDNIGSASVEVNPMVYSVMLGYKF